MSASTISRSRLAVAVAAALLAVVTGLASPEEAHAQAPEGVDGPWMNIFQLFWFTEPDYANDGTDQEYNVYYGQRFEYGKDRRPKCWYHHEDGPDADKVNSLYLMMSCRVGIVVGLVTWAAVGVALMTMAWNGLMHVVDSGAGGERAGVLRNMITSPLVGLLLVFMAYVIATLIYVVMRYNFERYLNPDVWNT